MWTRLLRSETLSKPLALQRSDGTILQSREISTTSAIHRGIRRSNGGINPKFAHRISPPANTKPALNESTRQHEKLHWNAKESRPRRPNHATRQDVEDIEESMQRAQNRVNERLERYKRGGRLRPTRSPIAARCEEKPRKGDTGVKSGFGGDDIDGQAGNRRNSSYRNGQTTVDDRANSYRRGRDRDRRGIPDRNELAHWQQREDAHPSRKGTSRPTLLELDTRSEIRPSFTRQNRGTVEDSSPRAFAQVRENGSADAYFSSRNTRITGSNFQEYERRPKDDSRLKYQHAADTNRSKGRVPGEAPAPLSIPYTTPASEFLYGTSVVMAALQADRRKFYKLYLYAGENRSTENLDEEIKRLAKKRHVEVVQVGIDWLNLLDKLSSGRPHNGYILEASPLPKHPAAGLLPVEGHNKPLRIVLDHQTKEDIAINGKDPFIKYKTSFPRYPFLLMLDEILDPGNLGAILRGAHFLGADGVIYSQRNCAPLSAITLKASAGASESLPLIPVSHPPAFIENAQATGWKFYAAAASQHKAVGRQKMVTTSNLGSPIRDGPCIVMLGSEGQGLRLNLLKKADHLLTIEGQRKDQSGVDSLNVSVAAALLCEAMLRRPQGDDSSQGDQKVVIELKMGDNDTSGNSMPKDLF